MSEPESLHTDEPLASRIERHWFDRLIMLSDGVFAIAMTLLALEVRPPVEWEGGLGELLEKSWRALLGYGLSFFIVGVFWFSNRSIMARVRRVDGPFSSLTLLFLCLICLTPFATALMAQRGPARSMMAYSILVGVAGTVQALLWGYAAFWRPLLDVEVSRRERWLTMAAFCLMPTVFCLGGIAIRPGASEVALLPVAVIAAALGLARRLLLRSVAPPRAMTDASGRPGRASGGLPDVVAGPDDVHLPAAALAIDHQVEARPRHLPDP